MHFRRCRMRRTVLVSAAATLWMTQSAFAQTSTATPTPQASPSQSAASPQTRPDAKYPKPSGQDSQPSQTKPTKSVRNGNTNGTVESRGSKTSDQSAASRPVAKQNAYSGNTGKKNDPGTAC